MNLITVAMGTCHCPEAVGWGQIILDQGIERKVNRVFDNKDVTSYSTNLKMGGSESYNCSSLLTYCLLQVFGHIVIYCREKHSATLIKQLHKMLCRPIFRISDLHVKKGSTHPS